MRNVVAMIARQPFGTTGHESSRMIFGAAALAHVSQDDADAALSLLLEHGVNRIGTATAPATPTAAHLLVARASR